MTLNINLTPQLEKLVRQKVESGRYNSASEVVREALRLMETQNELQQLQTTTAQQYLDNGPLLTQPIINTGTGARFLNYNRYYQTVGRPGTSTGGGVSYTQPQFNFGFRPR